MTLRGNLALEIQDLLNEFQRMSAYYDGKLRTVIIFAHLSDLAAKRAGRPGREVWEELAAAYHDGFHPFVRALYRCRFQSEDVRTLLERFHAEVCGLYNQTILFPPDAALYRELPAWFPPDGGAGIQRNLAELTREAALNYLLILKSFCPNDPEREEAEKLARIFYGDVARVYQTTPEKVRDYVAQWVGNGLVTAVEALCARLPVREAEE